ncbi:hypothetical protein T03_15878 [Trichinella britovi]|uniref:Uncharacterized protein n=1 Tax=Trichinella britovi TaxID=45882 RepID=A0A0V1DB21_TRIBR|nr:hypothetical protein T03_15878 [Trichinella britovi]
MTNPKVIPKAGKSRRNCCCIGCEMRTKAGKHQDNFVIFQSLQDLPHRQGQVKSLEKRNKPSPTADYTANLPLLHTLLLLPTYSDEKDSTERSCRMSFLTFSDKSTFCLSILPEQQEQHICSRMKLSEDPVIEPLLLNGLHQLPAVSIYAHFFLRANLLNQQFLKIENVGQNWSQKSLHMTNGYPSTVNNKNGRSRFEISKFEKQSVETSEMFNQLNNIMQIFKIASQGTVSNKAPPQQINDPSRQQSTTLILFFLNLVKNIYESDSTFFFQFQIVKNENSTNITRSSNADTLENGKLVHAKASCHSKMRRQTSIRQARDGSPIIQTFQIAQLEAKKLFMSKQVESSVDDAGHNLSQQYQTV